MKVTDKAKCLATAVLVCGAIYLDAASAVRVCDQWGCYVQDPPPGVTANNACELVLDQITVYAEGNIANCGYTENETNELTIEILD